MSVRLFAALELPGETRSALCAWAARAAMRQPAVRVLSPGLLHLTLVFLGSQDEAAVDDIAGTLASEARALDRLAVTGAAWLPPRRPGVLVADLIEDGERLARLQADVADALSPWHEPETRPFRPHVTVARVRRGERVRPGAVPEPPRLVFRAQALVLYRSQLGRGGARYEPVMRAAL